MDKILPPPLSCHFCSSAFYCWKCIWACWVVHWCGPHGWSTERSRHFYQIGPFILQTERWGGGGQPSRSWEMLLKMGENDRGGETSWVQALQLVFINGKRQIGTVVVSCVSCLCCNRSLFSTFWCFYVCTRDLKHQSNPAVLRRDGPVRTEESSSA